MKLRWKLGIAIPLTLLAIGVVCWFSVDDFQAWVYFTIRRAELAIHPPPPRCKQRAVEVNARKERIERDANNSLKIGTKRNDVIRFFAAENIPVTFDQIAGRSEATGTIFFKGDAACRSVACGDDSAMIDVRVNVDGNGTVVSNPVVVGMSTDCL
jgi:hypothetical protein